LGTFGGSRSCAYAINDSNQIVGRSDSGDWEASPFVTSFDPSGAGNSVKLYTEGVGWSINELGQVAGGCGRYHGSLFDITQPGTQIDLGILQEYTYSDAWSINNSGVIVGFAYNDWDYIERRAVLFTKSGWPNIDLGTLGGQHSWAFSINDVNQIVGGADDFNGYEFATIFDANGFGNNFNLGTVDGFDGSVASCINDKGQIVGTVYNSMTGQNAAVMFSGTGSGNVNLNGTIAQPAGLYLESTSCINDAGWIVGRGKNITGQYRAFLLIPAVECTEALAGDLNDDCKVNLKDFAMMANDWGKIGFDFKNFADIADNWLKCNLAPESACTQ
ncbi:MAG TPA: hypothetical protein VIJ25_01445, partial [Methylococcales bacterium]